MSFRNWPASRVCVWCSTSAVPQTCHRAKRIRIPRAFRNHRKVRAHPRSLVASLRRRLRDEGGSSLGSSVSGGPTATGAATRTRGRGSGPAGGVEKGTRDGEEGGGAEGGGGGGGSIGDKGLGGGGGSTGGEGGGGGSPFIRWVTAIAVGRGNDGRDSREGSVVTGGGGGGGGGGETRGGLGGEMNGGVRGRSTVAGPAAPDVTPTLAVGPGSMRSGVPAIICAVRLAARTMRPTARSGEATPSAADHMASQSVSGSADVVPSA